jgi:hypothetical protein
MLLHPRRTEETKRGCPQQKYNVWIKQKLQNNVERNFNLTRSIPVIKLHINYA